MKEKVLLLRANIVFALHDFFYKICIKLADRYHELYKEIRALWEEEE